MAIRRLPDDAVDKIRSSSTITSLNNAVAGLVKNALDASASKITIHVDYRRGNCTVQDNGLGIPPEEFQEHGGLGKLHSTSRLPPSPTIHGKRGDFLFSAASLSLLVVTSRNGNSEQSSSLSIHHGKRLSRDERGQSQQRTTAFEQGTRVDIRDLFGSLPVRVKHRDALFAERTDVEREFQTLVRTIAALLLSWPSAVSVSLREESYSREARLRSPKDTDLLAKVSRLFIQAGLADTSEAESWIPISASAGQISVDGCISMIPVASQKSQFISLGIQPAGEEYEASILFDEINKVFSASSFGLEEEDTDQASPSKAAKGRLRKGVEKWPMFYIRIQGYENDALDVGRSFAPQDLLSAIIDMIRAVCYGFLKKYNMRPRKVKRRSNYRSATPKGQDITFGEAKGRKSVATALQSNEQGNGITARTESPFDNWNRIKIGHRTLVPNSGKEIELPIHIQGKTEQERLIGNDGELLCRPFRDVATVSERQGTDTSTFPTNDLDKPASGWLQSMLQSWSNPTFEATEPLVSQLQNDESFGGRNTSDWVFNTDGKSLSGRVSRESLTKAEVIAQVDEKFILIKLPLQPNSNMAAGLTPSRALFLVDQHAADERCRLEALMSDYHELRSGSWRAVTENLEEPVIVELSLKEGQLLERHASHFREWAVIYHVTAPHLSQNEERHHSVVTVSALPPSILERCRSEPRVLVDLLRHEVWNLEEGHWPAKNSSQSKLQTKPGFQACPRGIIQLLHSRSCRSAIMFNDALTSSECESLIRRLSRCSFPFQCAHGRPSMAPLVDIGSVTTAERDWRVSSQRLGKSETSVMDSLAAWKQWLE